MVFQLRIALFTLLFGTVLSQNQHAILYDQHDQNGNYIKIREDYVANLADFNFGNQPKSLCSTGIWLFYQDANFNPVGGRGEIVIIGDDQCWNLYYNDGTGTISSVRYAGPSKDYRSDSITLYQYESFQGDQEFTLTNLPNLNLAGKQQSVIITGSSHWTVYDRPNYQGNSLCLIAQESRWPTRINNLQDADPSVPLGSIRSVRSGCWSLRNVTLSSFARGQYTFTPTQLE